MARRVSGMRALLATAVLFSLSSPAFAQPDDRLARLLEMQRAAPEDNGLQLLLAKEYIKRGDRNAAVVELTKAVKSGIDVDPDHDRDWYGLRNTLGFGVLLKKARASAIEKWKGVEAFRIPEKDLIPEGIAYDPVDRTLFVGSLNKRKIVRVTADGKAEDFVTTGQDGLGPVLGLRVDSKRHWLWACTGSETRPESSYLFAFEIGEKGRLVKKVHLATPGPHLLNDLVVTWEGEVFATDSEGGTVVRLAPDKDELQPFAQGFIYPNGIALLGDETTLFVADAKAGLTLVERSTGQKRALSHSKGVSPFGVDGLYFHDGGLVAVQNGAGKPRVVRYRLDPTFTKIVRIEILESRNPAFVIPTTAALAGEDLYILATSNLEALGKDGLNPNAKLYDVVILKRRL
jgi:sugar lactone lactonase YvrE